MTDSDKIRFLRSEGWLGKYLGDRMIKILDPIYGDSYRPEERRALDKAVSIAKSRKSARDTRRLKKAGYEYGMCLADGWGWFWSESHRRAGEFIGTKAEALATLGGSMMETDSAAALHTAWEVLGDICSDFIDAGIVDISDERFEKIHAAFCEIDALPPEARRVAP